MLLHAYVCRCGLSLCLQEGRGPTMPCRLRQACRGTKISTLCQSLLLHLLLVPPVTPFKAALCEVQRRWAENERGMRESETEGTKLYICMRGTGHPGRSRQLL
ncbi:hypothetical protein QQF64_034697 [Cirrhinus molitorella]|uniref:Secreted protein n=1 Tax=Cirrhinus molitorella TaxID=172907 RepID=A0ABR3L5J2_9TELE